MLSTRSHTHTMSGPTRRPRSHHSSTSPCVRSTHHRAPSDVQLVHPPPHTVHFTGEDGLQRSLIINASGYISLRSFVAALGYKTTAACNVMKADAHATFTLPGQRQARHHALCSADRVKHYVETHARDRWRGRVPSVHKLPEDVKKWLIEVCNALIQQRALAHLAAATNNGVATTTA